MKKILSFALFTLILSFILIPAKVNGEEIGYYKRGITGCIDNTCYVFANNGEYIEVLKVVNDKLIKISDIVGMERMHDLYFSQEGVDYYLYVLTGRYIIKYNVNDIEKPFIEIKRDLFQYRRISWQNNFPSSGYMLSISGNDYYIYIAGQKGVRRMSKENLFVDKIIFYEASESVVANNNMIVIVSNDILSILGIKDEELIYQTELKNLDMFTRKPEIDALGNVYFMSDNSLLKFNNKTHEVFTYYNPVADGLLYSYDVSVSANGEAYYVNGFGVSKFNQNFKKTGWLYLGNSKKYGKDSWSLNVETVNNQGETKVIVFNKSSVFLLDDSLQVLNQYKYTSLNTFDVPTDLNVISFKELGYRGENIQIGVYGFWPNEIVQVSFGETRKNIQVDNYGFASLDMEIPYSDKSTVVIEAHGKNSDLNYQTTFEAL